MTGEIIGILIVGAMFGAIIALVINKVRK